MGAVVTYICTRSTVDPYVPPMATSLPLLARDVADGFSALVGGHNVVGRLVQFPVQRSVPNHLLCDGREVAKVSFPELFAYLENSQGTPTDANYFMLPNYLTTIAPVASPVIETAVGGTVTSADPTPPPAPPAGTPPPPPEEYPLYGPVDSGGRYRRGTGTEVIP